MRYPIHPALRLPRRFVDDQNIVVQTADGMGFVDRANELRSKAAMHILSLALALALSFAPKSFALTPLEARGLLEVGGEAGINQIQRQFVERCYERITESHLRTPRARHAALKKIRDLLEARRLLVPLKIIKMPVPWPADVDPLSGDNQDLYLQQYSVIGSELNLYEDHRGNLLRTARELASVQDPRAGKLLRMAALTSFLSVFEVFLHPEDYGLELNSSERNVVKELNPELAPSVLLSDLLRSHVYSLSFEPQILRDKVESSEFYRRLRITFDLPLITRIDRTALSFARISHGFSARMAHYVQGRNRCTDHLVQ